MASPTMLSVGSVTLTANGGLTGNLLAAVVSATAAIQGTANVVLVGAGATSLPAPPAGTGPFELVIQPGYTGALVIPAGWSFVIDGAGSTGSLTGADGSTTVVGDLNYSGPAGAVLATGGSGTVSSTATGALLSFSTGAYSVTATGNNDTINLDIGTASDVDVTGTNATLNLGSPSATAAGALASASSEPPPANIIDLVPTGPGVDVANVASGSDDELVSRSPLEVNAMGGAVTVITGGAGNVLTVNATGGFQLLLDNVGGSMVNAGPATDFINDENQSVTSTITASAGGDDTVWALTGVQYDGSLAATSFFVGSPTTGGAETATLGANATVFGGANGGMYTEGSSNFLFLGNVVGQAVTTSSASDTIMGSASGSAVAWGNNNENITVSQSGVATAFNSGGAYVALGNNDVIDATNASGGDSFIVFNATLPGGLDFVGSTTLIGANAGLEDLGIFASATTPAHTVDVQNWKSDDVLFLGGYSSADVAIVTSALTDGNGAPLSFTLSDGTTVKFDNASPTLAFFQHSP